MNETLRKKMLAAREQWVDVGRFGFLVRRPTEMQITRWRGNEALEVTFTIVAECVVGWRGVTEADLVPGGSDDQMPFDADAYRMWAEDRPDVWQPLAEAVMRLVDENRKRLESAQGN